MFPPRASSAYTSAAKKSSNRFVKYNLSWQNTVNPLSIEMDMIIHGGQWMKKNGEMAGEGLFTHYQNMISILWPEIVWHKWNTMFLEEYLTHRTIGCMGPASTGKTNSAAIVSLADYYCFATCTTVLCCSTTRERLEDRIWGELKKFHRLAKAKASWLPGHLIEGRQRIITDSKFESIEGRDFRNGLIGVPCKRGENYVGLGDYAGIKNKRVRLIGDEIHLLPRVWVDSISNLDKNPDFKGVGLGNPKDTTDALGVFCEPAAYLGGWEGGIDQTPDTKKWATRRPDGICLQFPGSDSPNLDGLLGAPLITQEAINRDIEFYGKDSLWFTMMNEGRMPKGQGSRRVITRQMCLKFHAMDEPVWLNNNRTKIGFLDPAFRGTGGDRCVFGELQFGHEAVAIDTTELKVSLTSQGQTVIERKTIMALIDLVVVPVSVNIDELPEDQIAVWCKNQCDQRGINPANFFYDASMRGSLVTAFARLWTPQVNAIDFGGSPTERKVSSSLDILCKDYYSKFVTELWFSVRLIIEADQFRGLTEECMMEGCQREWGMVGKNKIEVESKEDMKLKTGRSPDLFDALVVGVEGARQRGFVIHRLGSKKMRVNDDEWRRKLREDSKKVWGSKQLTYN